MFGRRSQRDFEDEIRSHLEMEVDRLQAQGLSRADAERVARRAGARRMPQRQHPTARE